MIESDNLKMKELGSKELKMIFLDPRSFAKSVSPKILMNSRIWQTKNSTETLNKIWCLHMNITIQDSSCSMRLLNSQEEEGREQDILKSTWVSMKITLNNLPLVADIWKINKGVWRRPFKPGKANFQNLWTQKMKYNRGPYPCPGQIAYLIKNKVTFERKKINHWANTNQIEIYLNLENFVIYYVGTI